MTSKSVTTMARSVIKIDKNGIPDAAKSVIIADIRRFLRNDCEYFWEEKTQMIIERDPDGNMCKMNFSLICERFATIKIRPKEAEV